MSVRCEPKAGDHLECDHGSGCCRQTWNGVDSLDEEGDRHALTVLSARAEPTCSGCGGDVEARACTACAAPLLARALFRTDPRAVAFVELVSDHLCWPSYEGSDIDFTKLEAAWITAWDRNEGGWRREATDRATAMLDIIRATPHKSVTKETP